MTNSVILQPNFSNAQLELLGLFKENLSEDKLKNLRKVLANFMLDQVLEEAKKTSEQRQYDDDLLKKLVRGDV
jgi:hypothetical protein